MHFPFLYSTPSFLSLHTDPMNYLLLCKQYCHKLHGLKQHTSVISQSLWVSSWLRQVPWKPGISLSVRAGCSSGGSTGDRSVSRLTCLLAYSVSWGCGTEGFSFLLVGGWRLPSAFRGHSQFLVIWASPARLPASSKPARKWESPARLVLQPVYMWLCGHVHMITYISHRCWILWLRSKWRITYTRGGRTTRAWIPGAGSLGTSAVCPPHLLNPSRPVLCVEYFIYVGESLSILK